MGGKVLFMAAATAAVDTIPHCDFALISAVAFYLRARNLSMFGHFSFLLAVCTWPMSQSQSQLPVGNTRIALSKVETSYQ